MKIKLDTVKTHVVDNKAFYAESGARIAVAITVAAIGIYSSKKAKMSKTSED